MEENSEVENKTRRSRRARRLETNNLATGEIPRIHENSASIPTKTLGKEKKPDLAGPDLNPELSPGIEIKSAKSQKKADLPLNTEVSKSKNSVHEIPSRRKHQTNQKIITRKNRVRQLSGWELLRVNLTLILLVVFGALIITTIGIWINPNSQELELSTDLKETVQITGEVGTNPVLNLKRSLPLTIKKETVITVGDGPALKPGDDIYLKISVFDGNTGKLVNKNGLPRQIMGKNSSKQLGGELFETVKNKKIGSRLLVKRPVKNTDGTGSMEIDIVDILPTIVKEKNIPDSLPAGYYQENDLPKLAKTDFSFESNQLFVIHRGDGKQIPANGKVLTQIGIWHGGKNKPVTYSWNNEGPKLLDLAKSYRSLAKQLPDIRQGSRILLTIPAEDADGDTSVLVVLDILGIADPKQ